MSLSHDEIALLRSGEKISAGEKTPLAADEARPVAASLLRAILFGLRLPDGSPPSPPPPLLHLQGFWIDGDLNLRDMRGPAGEVCTALVLEHCTFSGELDLRDARLARLSLKGSRFRHLEARHLRVDGAVDLSEVESSEMVGSCTGCERGDDTGGKDGKTALPRCWIDLGGAELGSHLTAKNAKLCAPPRESSFDRSAGGLPAALRLVGARIAGSAVLQPGLVAHGGVSASAARIGGDLWLNGARLTEEINEALDIQQAEIGGSVMLATISTEGEEGAALPLGRVDYAVFRSNQGRTVYGGGAPEAGGQISRRTTRLYDGCREAVPNDHRRR